MAVVTDAVQQWISCCNDLWLRWFSTRENGADEFLVIEDVLLRIFVLEKKWPQDTNLSTDQFFEKLLVMYPKSVNESRQTCTKQRAGNVFCRTQPVAITENSIFKVKSIDTMGTMQNGQPYVEVVFGKGYILEQPEN